MRLCLSLLVAVSLSVLLSACSSLPFGNSKPDSPASEQPIDVSRAHRDPTLAASLPQGASVTPTKINNVQIALALKNYQRVLKSTKNPKLVADILHRLGDLTLRLAEEREIQIVEGKQIAQLPEALRDIDYADALTYYERLLKIFPDYPRAAEVRYQMAKAYQLTGRSNASITVLESLVQGHPKHEQVPEAHFRRGEIYFNKKQFSEALQAYQTLVNNFPESSFFLQARYKLGWSIFKLNQFDQAAESFYGLLDILAKRIATDENNTTLQTLYDDTFRVMALCFYHQLGPSSLRDFYAKKQEKRYELRLYQRLADLYLERERFVMAAETYRQFIKEYPKHEKATEWQGEIIAIYQKHGFPSRVLPEKEKMIAQYGVSSPFWASASEAARENAKKALRPHFLDVISFYHARAQKRKNRTDYLKAASLYREFLLTFPNDPELDKKQFLLAESLRDGQAFQDAISVFENMAYRQGAKYRREDAGYAALVIYQNLINRAKPESKRQWEQRFVKASERFAKVFPNNQNAPRTLQAAVAISLARKDLAQAIRLSRQLLGKDIKITPKQRLDAKKTIADAEFDLKNYAAAEKAIAIVLADPLLPVKEKASYRKSQQEAIFQQAMALKKAGKSELALKQFLRLTQGGVTRSVQRAAIFDAATIYQQTGKLAEAKPLLLRFRQQFPGDPLQKQIPERLIAIYESEKNWQQAAREWQNLAKAQTPGSKDQGESYWRAAELYEKAGNNQQAIASYRSFAHQSKGDIKQNVEAKFRLVELYKKMKQKDKSDFWRRELIKMQRRLGRRSPDRLNYLAAESSLYFAEPLFKRFQSIRLTQPITQSLGRKQRAMNSALSAYARVLDYNVLQFRTAASFKIGEIYRGLANSIMKSERPKGMSEEALEEYEIVLEEKAIPFEDKAIEAHEKNIGHIKQDAYDNWVAESLAALGEVMPARYRKEELTESYVQEVR